MHAYGRRDWRRKRWDIQRDEESKQEYKEMRREAKKEVAKAKSKAYAYDELYEGLDTKEEESATMFPKSYSCFQMCKSNDSYVYDNSVHHLHIFVKRDNRLVWH